MSRAGVVPPLSDDEGQLVERVRQENMAGGGIKYTPVIDLCSSESDEVSRATTWQGGVNYTPVIDLRSSESEESSQSANEDSQRPMDNNPSDNEVEGVGTSAAHAGARRRTIEHRTTGAAMLIGLQIRIYTSYMPTTEHRGLRGRTADVAKQARDGQTDSFRLRFSGASRNVTAILGRHLRVHSSAELTRVGQWQTVYNNGLETPLEQGERHCQTCFFPSMGTCPICTGGGGQATRSGKRRER